MIFFINSQMPLQKSGIEHAEIKRMQLFRKNNQAFRLILRDFSYQTHYLTKQAGISDDEVINMFDYYQQAQAVADNPTYLADLDFGVENIVAQEDFEQKRYLVVDEEQRLIARVNVDLEQQKEVRSVELFDAFGNLYQVDTYDIRGFLAMSQWYTPDNHVKNEAWYTPAGQIVIEAFYQINSENKMEVTGWKLTDVKQKVYQFDTIEMFTKHFLDDLNAEYSDGDKPNIFIMDRNHLADWALLNLKQPAYTVMHLHNSHASDAQEPMHSNLNQHYAYGLNNINRYDAVISATEKQTTDVQQRFHPTSKLFTIPVGIVPQKLLDQTPVKVADRKFAKMVVFARIAWEKHLDDLVRAIAIVKESIPEVTLDLYGYADPNNNYEAKRQIEAVITEHHLEDVVSFKGYTNDIDQTQNQAMMFGVTSRMEGFNLAVMEAISHGLITFSYDVNYGPNEIVEDGINGNVVPYGDYQAMAQAIIKVLQDPKLAQAYSTGAYQSAQRFSEQTVWEAWQALIDDAQQAFNKKGGQ